MAVPLYCSYGRSEGEEWVAWVPAPPALQGSGEHTHLHVMHDKGGNRGLQQCDGAATKATTCHATAINPRHRERGLNQLVQLRAAHLEVISAEDIGVRGTWDLPVLERARGPEKAYLSE